MTTKQQAHAKISAAEVACSEVQSAWAKASAALSGGVSVNGYGIYHGSHPLRSKLLAAQSHINDAIKALDAVDWPTDDEYDTL